MNKPKRNCILQRHIKDWRKGLKLTQAQAAKLLGVSVRAVKHWEAGTRNPTTSILLLMECVTRENRPRR